MLLLSRMDYVATKIDMFAGFGKPFKHCLILSKKNYTCINCIIDFIHVSDHLEQFGGIVLGGLN